MIREKKIKFLGLKCPNPGCGAKNIIFVSNKNAYNHTKLLAFAEASENISADYIVVCPKCKSYLMLCEK